MSGTIKCIYWGIFFGWDDLPEGALFRDIEHKHVTFGFRTPFPEELLGMEASVFVTGYGNDNVNEALSVEMPAAILEYYDREERPHITLSVSSYGAPKDSAYLDFEPISGYAVSGVFGYYGFDQEVHV